MTTVLERIEPIGEALARLRAAPLEVTGNEIIPIYRHATLRTGDFFPDELNPTALYVLARQIEYLQNMRRELLARYQIDILRLSSILHLRDERDGRLYGMAPPFVEIYEERVQIQPLPGDREPSPLSLKIPILKDGIHRAWIAREERVMLGCIVAHGALPDHLPYAYPNEWSQVRVVDGRPEQKKIYRRQVPYSYLRPLKALRQTGDEAVPSEWGR